MRPPVFTRIYLDKKRPNPVPLERLILSSVPTPVAHVSCAMRALFLQEARPYARHVLKVLRLIPQAEIHQMCVKVAYQADLQTLVGLRFAPCAHHPPTKTSRVKQIV